MFIGISARNSDTRTCTNAWQRLCSNLFTSHFDIFQYCITAISICVCSNVHSRPAPKLKDVELSESKARELYLQCIQLMRIMYHDSKLIHADLSEFNML